jgi:two-component system, LytTR family, sensor kinase
MIPYKKIIRLALTTAPLFGLFGATPPFVMGNMEVSRIPAGFILVTAVTLIFWFINISLLKGAQNFATLKNNWVRYIVSISAAAIIIFIIVTIILSHDMHLEFPVAMIPKRRFIFLPLIQAESINIIIIVLIELVLLQDEKLLIQDENNLLRVANLEAKHNHLKQQLHPHFLFNSLSTLRSLIKRSPQQAEEYLERLSEILRFSINTNMQTLVPLKEEMELSTNYLLMQQVRFGRALNYYIDIPKSMLSGSRLPVYSIQLLVENAVKHNILTTAKPLYISIKGYDLSNTITVTNNLQPKLITEESNGMGLANLSERYKLLGREDIVIIKTKSEFTVTIKVLEYEGGNS